MVTVAAARDAARKRVMRDQRAWAVSGGADALLDLPLHPPSERTVRDAPAAALSWVHSWRGSDGVRWTTRSWPGFGTQEVPERLILTSPDAIAGFAGPEVRRSWRTVHDRVADLLERFGRGSGFVEAVQRSADAIAGLPSDDLDRLVAMLRWLEANPASGMRLRQLPVHGVHTKWLEAHRALVLRLHIGTTGGRGLGLLEKPVMIRIRALDPALRPGGLVDVTAPVEDLAALRTPDAVLVLENLETLLALPELPGTVAVLGAGYGAGGRLGAVPWLHDAPMRYWGDLDSHGFRILDDLRATFPAAESVLMDEQTLLEHRDLWVPEPQIAVGSFPRLTVPESAALTRLRAEGGVRLEQERIDWATVLNRL